MPEAASFPAQLLTRPKAERLSYFKRYTIAHSTLKTIDGRLWRAIEEAGGAGLVMVYGPTGVGKSTLMERIAERLSRRPDEIPASESHLLPVVKLEAAAPEQGNFQWGHFFRQALLELETPFLKDRMEYSDSPVYFDRAGNLRIGRRPPIQDLRDAVEKALRYRRPQAFIIDEAQHLAKLTSGRRLQDQMDALKSLANRSHTLLVLIGTYELLSFHQLSGQLSRRSFELHFPRYGTSAGELKAFQSAIYAFQCQLPLIKAPELSRHWEYIYARSVGCIGILKDWLIRSLSEAYDRGEKTITLKLLQECAMSIGQCEQMAIEAREGEERIREGTAGGAQRLIQILGLTPGTRRGRPVAFGEAQEGIKPGSRIKRRVGRRNPKRDDVA